MTSTMLVREGTSPRTLVAQYFRMWNSGDTSVLAELISPAWVDHAHPNLGCPAEIGKAIRRLRKREPGLRVYIDAMLGDGNVITVNGRVLAGGEFTSWVWLVRVENEQLAEMWTYSAD
jgi:hypothetical protein